MPCCSPRWGRRGARSTPRCRGRRADWPRPAVPGRRRRARRRRYFPLPAPRKATSTPPVMLWPRVRSCSEPWGANGAAPRSDALHSPPRGVLWSCGRVPCGDRREPCGPGGQPVDNAHALPTACPHSRASRPQPPQDQQPSRFNKTPSHLTSPTPTHHHLPLIHNTFELAPPPPDAPHRSGSSLDWITLSRGNPGAPFRLHSNGPSPQSPG